MTLRDPAVVSQRFDLGESRVDVDEAYWALRVWWSRIGDQTGKAGPVLFFAGAEARLFFMSELN